MPKDAKFSIETTRKYVKKTQMSMWRDGYEYRNQMLTDMSTSLSRKSDYPFDNRAFSRNPQYKGFSIPRCEISRVNAELPTSFHTLTLETELLNMLCTVYGKGSLSRKENKPAQVTQEKETPDGVPIVYMY
jgi:hypothetical protein